METLLMCIEMQTKVQRW